MILTYKEKKKIWDRNWRQNNKDKRRVYEQNRRARKRYAEGVITKKTLEYLFYSQAAWCYYCLCDISQYFEVEHKIPLIKGGSNLVDNLCLSCKNCNSQKGTKTEVEFVNWKVGLKNAV